MPFLPDPFRNFLRIYLYYIYLGARNICILTRPEEGEVMDFNYVEMFGYDTGFYLMDKKGCEKHSIFY